MIDYPNKLNKIFDKLNSLNATPIIIGGYIRDKLLQIPTSKDIDIEVYHISSLEKLEEILSQFAKVNSVGKSFGVCKLQLDDLELDFSLPRSDSKTASGHKGFKVQYNGNLDFKTAASRRDFTINSIGFNTIEKKLIDPFGGQNDLKNKILRATDIDKFSQDPLRVLRAVQFYARFDLSIDKELLAVCKKMVAENILSELSKERIFQEIKKLLLKSIHPSKGFILLKELGTFDHFHELQGIDELQWEHTLRVLDEMAKLKTNNEKTDTLLMLCILCHSFENTTHYTKTKSFIQKLTNENELLKQVINLVENYNAITALKGKNIEDAALYKIAQKSNIEKLLLISEAEYFAEEKNEDFTLGKMIRKRAKELHILNQKVPSLLQGKDLIQLGLEPSKRFSHILDDAYTAQIEGKFSSHEDALKWLRSYLLL